MIERQQLLENMEAKFDVNFVGPRFVEGLSSTLFESHGLHYWLPLYDTAHLAVYPNAENALRLFYFLSIVHKVIQERDLQDHETDVELIFDLLEHSRILPENSRLFATANTVANSDDVMLIAALYVSEISMLLGVLIPAECIWCTMEQDNKVSPLSLLRETCANNGVCLADNKYMVMSAVPIIKNLVESGQETILGGWSLPNLSNAKT